MSSEPFDHVKAGKVGQFYVQQNEAGKRIFLAVREGAYAGDIVKGLLAVVDDMQRSLELCFLPGAFHHVYVCRIIFHKEY